MKSIRRGTTKNKDFSLLKRKDVFDAQGEKILKQVLKKYKKILIMGNHKTGKAILENDLIKEACVNYCQGLQKGPIVFPTIQVNSMQTFFKSGIWKNYARILNQNLPSVFTISHKTPAQNVDKDLSKTLTKIKSKFDAIIDLRTLPGGKKIIYQVLVRSGNAYKALYVNEKFFLKFGPTLIAA